MKKLKNKKYGFTLIELLATIVILGLLALIVTPGVAKVIRNSKFNTSKASLEGYIRELENASALYMSDTGAYPNSIEDLELDGKNLDKVSDVDVELENGTVKKLMARVNEVYCKYEKGKGTECQENMFIGTNLYYDPVNNVVGCTTYTESNSASGVVEGCLRWNVLSVEEDGTLNLLLDHNILSGTKWYSSMDNSQGPTVAVEALNNAIKDTWSANLIRTDSYSHTFNNGTENKTYEVSYSGMKARLPEAQEIVNAVGHDTWNEDTATISSKFYFDSKNQTLTVGYGKEKTISDYAWLFNNLNYGSNSNNSSDEKTCLYYGCSQNFGDISGDRGYWTSTAVCGSSLEAWRVNRAGNFTYTTVSNVYYGVRPVISLNPNIFN